MAKVELQVKGREALQKRLNEKRQQIISYLNMRLMQLAEEAEGGQEGVSAALNEYAQKEGVVAPKGYSLVIVAGMNYGKYVEDKGYNVLHLTKYFLRKEMKKIFEEVAEMIKSDS